MKLVAITAYFNPMRYRSRLLNYRHFADALEASGVDLMTVECILPGRTPELTDSGDNVIVVQADDILWQKERLLNLGIRQLPDDCNIIAWIDCDVLFDDCLWPAEAIRLMDTHHVVQLFSEVAHLRQGERKPDIGTTWLPSYGAKLNEVPRVAGSRFAEHGHTGFAWAVRRSSIADIGLFDSCIAGGADHLMAHAFSGDGNARCVDRLLGRHSPLRVKFDQWSERLSRVIDGNVGVCRGRLLHLWHGSLENRRYRARNDHLIKLGFDPTHDLMSGPDGCWSLTDRNSPIAQFLSDYFCSRKEDG